MSDREIRLLERRAKEGGQTEATALLRARVRAGLVPQERVDLAARLGDPVARECCTSSDRARLDWSKHEDRVEAFRGLDHSVVVGLVCDWADGALCAWKAVHPDDSRPRLAVEATRAWLLNPSINAMDTVRTASKAAALAAKDAKGPAWSAAWAARAVARVVRNVSGAAVWAVWAARAAGNAGAVGAGAVLEHQRLDVIRALLTPEDPT